MAEAAQWRMRLLTELRLAGLLLKNSHGRNTGEETELREIAGRLGRIVARIEGE